MARKNSLEPEGGSACQMDALTASGMVSCGSCEETSVSVLSVRLPVRRTSPHVRSPCVTRPSRADSGGPQSDRIYWNVIMSRALVLRPNSDGEGTPDVVHLGAVDDAIRLEARPPASVESAHSE